MLIEALANLAAKVGAERISLEIPPTEGGSCAVMVVTSLGHSVKVTESEQDAKLLAALAAPLVVEGNVGELDSRLVSLIDDLEGDFEAASQSLPETSAQKRKRELKEAAEKEEKKTGKAGEAKGATKKGGKKAETVIDAESDTEQSHDDALASGEADSL